MTELPQEIGMHALAQLLGVTPAFFKSRRRAGTLVPNQAGRYSLEQIDTVLLQPGARNFVEPPRMVQLLNRELTLITSAQVSTLLGISETSVYTWLYEGTLPGIKLGGRTWRLSSSHAVELKALQAKHDTLSRSRVMQVLGISDFKLVQAFVKHGPLVEAKSPPGHATRVKSVTRQSVLELLEALLPNWLSPEDWLEDRLAVAQPLLPPSAAAELLGIRRDDVPALLTQEQLPYLTLPSRYVRVPSSSVEVYLERLSPLPMSTIQVVLGANRAAAYSWRQQGKLSCPFALHHHSKEDVDLCKPCLLGVLKQWLSPGLSPGKWYASRMTRPVPLLSSADVAKRIGEPTARRVEQLAATGQLKGIRYPSGAWAFRPKDIPR